MVEQPDDPKDTRADFVKLQAKGAGGEDLLQLFGTGRQVFQRVLQVLAGMQNVEGVSVSLDRAIKLGGLVIDATRAPFRINGRKWSAASNLAAPGATSNIVRAQNRPSAQPKDGLALVTIEEVRYQGPSVVGVKVVYRSTIAELAAGRARDMETPVTTSDDGTIKEKNVVQQVGYIDAAGSVSPDWTAFLANVAAGSPPDIYQPDGLVLWPGEILDLFQVTQNQIMTVTVSGKVWFFTQKSPS